MGRKVHPVGFRIGITRGWSAKWYAADKDYTEFLKEDLKLRRAIKDNYAEAGISQFEIERQANRVSVTIYTAWPGIVIGRGGQRVDEMRRYLEGLIGKRVQLNIREIRQPELDAYLVARSVAERIERRVAYRRVMKQAIFRTIQAGAKGIRICCSGRLAGAEIARTQTMHEGRVPLHTLRADIDYGLTEARTALGRIGVKVWIYKGDVIPEPVAEKEEEMPAAVAAGGITGEELPAAGEPVEGTVEPAEVTAEPVEVAVESLEVPAETVAEKGEETPVQKPARKRAAKVTEAAPVAEAEKKPARKRVAKVSEAAPVAEAEKKPARKRAAKVSEAAPVAEAEKKPAKKKVAKSTKAKPSAKSE